MNAHGETLADCAAMDTLQLLHHLREEEVDFSSHDMWRLKVSERLALAENSWFARLSSAIRHDLLRAIRVRSYASGEDIFLAAEPVRAWMVCLSGSVRVATPLQTGRSLTLRYLRAGQWFGDLPAPQSSGHTHEASAMGATRVGEVDREAVDALMKKHAEFRSALLDWQSMRLKSVFRLLQDHATLTLRARLARHLYRLAIDHGVPNDHGEVKLALSLLQTDLAGLVGCSRQRTNRQLVEFVRDRVIRHEAGAYVVTDMGSLVRHCEMPATGG